MLLVRMSLRDVRNYDELEFAPPPGLTIVAGANGQGKSNLLEAIGLLAIGRSFRTSHEREVVRVDRPQAVVSGEASGRAGILRLGCAITRAGNGTRKRYEVNGNGVRFRSYLGRARVVTFVPADLELAAGAPSRRRSLLNAALAQRTAGYYDALASYAKYLAQKNAMLRGAIAFDGALLDTYDERLAATGERLIGARTDYVARLAEQARIAYERIAGSGDGPVDVRYVPDAAATTLGERLRVARPAELARKVALAGPHRDDLALTLDGRSLSAFGSQGQQRSAVLALKVAEYLVRDADDGEAPLLLLDDVLSELDPARKSAFLAALEGVEQAFVTATVAPSGLRSAATYEVRAGRVQQVA